MSKKSYEGEFKYHHSGEPHFLRRQVLIKKHPEIAELMGYDPMQAVQTVLITLLMFALAFGAKVSGEYIYAEYGMGWLITFLVVTAYGIGAWIAHWLAMAVHETSHNLMLKKPWQNKVLAIFANFPVLLPLAMSFHRYHVRHHIYLGVDEMDEDLPTKKEVEVVGNNRVLKFLWVFFNVFFYVYRGAAYSKSLDRWEIANIIVMIPVITAIYIFMGPIAIAFLLLSALFGLGLAFHPAAAHFIHEHYIFADDQETYSYYGWINKITFNVGYHIEHHDFMNIPGSRLPELYRRYPQYYDKFESHNSWSWVLAHFAFNEKMGLASRIVRTVQDYKNKTPLTGKMVVE